ncbi:cysteine-rich CWC family protein [Aquabacterium sp.]|uniref:cysteine-rich CWC family protein n=1 Tax=Aquabacterium sp. TaxID=1872578 RepID=UPI002B85495E|nr:cysteine-rich CWC family protein [Aquabacterium sp.]HSW05964.1 cysteine-rich CWC family protein [Aquabacterium sp.]
MSPDPSPVDKRCPRCGQGFHCGITDAGPCPCTHVRLDGPTLAALRQRHADCLCLRCLGELAQQGIDTGSALH